MPVTYTIHVTDMAGNEAKIVGHKDALERIEDALYQAGARFERTTECWDFGFYSKGGDYDQERGAPLNSPQGA